MACKSPVAIGFGCSRERVIGSVAAAGLATDTLVLATNDRAPGHNPWMIAIAAQRDSIGPGTRSNFLGFRVSLVPADMSGEPAEPPIAAPGGKAAPTANSESETQISKPAIPAPAHAGSPGKEISVDLGKGIKLDMVLISPGEFMMGSPDSDKDAKSDEKP